MAHTTMTIEVRLRRRVNYALAVAVALGRVWAALRLPVSDAFLDRATKRFAAWAAAQIVIAPSHRQA